MQMFGRRIILTTLDEIPRAFRAAPGVLALTHEELRLLQGNDAPTFKRVIDIVQAEDADEARRVFVRRPPRKRRNLSPSNRLALANAIYKGRT